MAQPHVQSGQIVSVLALGDQLVNAKTTALLKAEQLEVMRVVLPVGKTMREHKAPGESTVQCIEGRIEIQTLAALQVLGPGDFVYLRAGEPHSLRALSDASALVTMCLVARH